MNGASPNLRSSKLNSDHAIEPLQIL